MRKYVCLVVTGPWPHYVTGVEHCCGCPGGQMCRRLRHTTLLADELDNEIIQKEKEKNGDSKTASD